MTQVKRKKSFLGTGASEPDRNRQELELVRRYKETKRLCMRCRREFTSTGPHHRMCNDCRREV